MPLNNGYWIQLLLYTILSEANNKEGIKESKPVYEEGDFESVCKTIENQIINQGKCISIDTLLNMYRENFDEKKKKSTNTLSDKTKSDKSD